MSDLININANVKRQLENKSFYSDCDIVLEDAASVINVEAKAYITSQETLADEIRVCGKVCFTAIYLDSENSFRNAEMVKNYEDTIIAQDITPLDFSILNVAVLDTDYIGLGTVKARATLELSGSYITKRDIAVMENAGENVLMKKQMLNIQNVIAMPDCVVEFNDSLDIDEDCNRILANSTKAIITKTMQGQEVITIHGQATTQITYVAKGVIRTQEYINDFSGEIISEDINLDTKVNAIAQVLSDSVKLVDSKRGKECEVAFSIKISCMAVCQKSVEAVTDAYSVNNECNLANTNYQMDKLQDTVYFRERLVTTVEIAEDAAAIKSVMSILSPAIGAINISSSDRSMVEGIVSCTTLYLDENEKLEKLDSEIPYQFRLLDEFFDSNIDALNAQIASITCKLKHSRVIELSIELSIAVNAREKSRLNVLSNVELLGEKEKPDYAIPCVLAKPGDDIWNISKTLSVEADILLDINKDVELPLKGGEKLIYYRNIE